MSEDLNQFSLNMNWVITGLIAVWGFTLRLIIGRHYAAVDKINARLDSIERQLSEISGYLDGKDGRH